VDRRRAGLNLILGWAGQFHFGYAAIMGIGAYTAVHATRNGIPWEIAIVLAGAVATLIGMCLRLRRAARERACTWRCRRWPCSS
jgi:ABC-type branched-subunit amino acid transport system permease subunit